jgi:hypothetical protein
MPIFEPRDDSAYLNWLASNPDGYVINTEPGGHGYARLHRVVCDTIRTRPPYVGQSYVKICSASLDELDDWALERRNATVQRCAAYQCWP